MHQFLWNERSYPFEQGAGGTFWRHCGDCEIYFFSVKPLKDYLTIHYPKIMAAYAELEKRRDKYDSARVKRSPNAPILQQQLCEQAAVLEGLLNMVPEHQINGAKAIDVYVSYAW